MSENWRLQASCKDFPPALADRAFFPRNGDISAATQAMCGACPVRTECGQFGVDNDTEGVWGGEIRPTLGSRSHRVARAAARESVLVVSAA